jgi:hypothetical protein
MCRNLALALQLLQCPHRLVVRNEEIHRVELVELDGLETESLQASLARLL